MRRAARLAPFVFQWVAAMLNDWDAGGVQPEQIEWVWIVEEKRRASVDEIRRLRGISGKFHRGDLGTCSAIRSDRGRRALAGDDRLYLYGADQETGEEIELGGSVFPSGAGRCGDPGSVCRGSMGGDSWLASWPSS
jgi:hypothetical protein